MKWCLLHKKSKIASQMRLFLQARYLIIQWNALLSGLVIRLELVSSNAQILMTFKFGHLSYSFHSSPDDILTLIVKIIYD